MTLVSHSLDLIRRLQAPTGAYPASPTFSAYRGYSWLRDGAFIAEGVSRHGDASGADAFHAWCARVVGDRAGQVDALVSRAARGETVSPAEMLPTRFTLEGADGTEEWWDFQLDGYGTWLWALLEHARRHGRTVAGTDKGVRAAARYLTAFWHLPCYDWWEEHLDRRHVATLGSVHAGLRAAIGLGVLSRPETEAAEGAVAGIAALVAAEGVTRPVDGRPHLTKWLGTDAVDASLLACVTPFGLYGADDPVGAGTVAEVERRLARDGGVYRYLDDTFYGGGRWVLLAGFLGWNHARAGRSGEARRYLRWMEAQATPAGDLPEQVSDLLLDPGRRQEWLDRWGPVATPLLWSHGMYLILADELEVGA
ncbi:glycoside hydrolase family 15 protein [Nonomuraea ferruginea]|uniref:Glycoside hydrolase family 15 protein n=1 Tax=Nonomuraea ferruginea TaxID=46174 RepID=A0ABT4SSQ3_9ACTN|nr:glycoside hydrolase family 15 protein [Nonomuraea ferruginea]MDA0640287.1 glycoside hydrolase family 15 protein [Nonomuraea ferruginea]